MSNLSENQSKPPFWKRDLTAKWQSGEFIEADPAAGRRDLLCALMILLLAVVLKYWFVGDWFQRQEASLVALAKTNPEAACQEAASYIGWLRWILTLICLGMACYCGVNALRALRAGRWPLPGQKVRRRTQIRRGALLKLYLTGELFISVICLGSAGCTYFFIKPYSQATTCAVFQKKTGKPPIKRPAGQSVSQPQKVTASPSE